MGGTTTRRTQQERVNESTYRLIEAAAELIAEQGYQATTAAQIADRAGYSREMVRLRFGSKDALITEVLRAEYVDWFSTRFVTAGTGYDKLLASADRLRELAEQSPVYLRAAFVLQLEAATSIEMLRPHVAEWKANVQQAFTRALREGIRDGSIRPDIDPQVTAEQLVALCVGSAYDYVLDEPRGRPRDPARLFRRAVEDLAR